LSDASGIGRRVGRASLVLLGCALRSSTAAAGPPYVTDDPEPVEYRHWEVYLASISSKDGPTWSGTAPHLEVNYGIRPDVQLHVIAPLAFSSTIGGAHGYGYGDTELGVKVRFVHEDVWVPQLGIFTLLEVPTGDATRGLGVGHAQVYLPLWAQKTLGTWTTYGGGGVWLEATPGHHSYGFVGWHLERKIQKVLAIGVEIFHTTAHGVVAPAETRLDVGVVLDLGELHHVMLSAGRGVQGPNTLQTYLAYQLTFGGAGAR
jgi:hypothetical protein